MSDNEQETLEEVLRRTPWSAILVPLAIALLVIAISLVAVMVEN